MPDIELTIEGPVATVVLNRPAKRNAMTLAMWSEMARIFGDLDSRRDVRGIVLTGAGDSFSVGADIAEFDAVRADAAAAKVYEDAVDACADAIAACPKTTIAVLDGYCLGGGCHLALACDFRYASPRASLGIPAAKLSIVYGVRSTQRLLALVGLAAAKQVLYSGRRYAASDAQAIGLVERVEAQPLAAALETLSEMATSAPLSIAGAKAILTDLSMGPGKLDAGVTNAIIAAAADSADYREGRLAFAEKRPPQFRGA